MTTDKPRKPWVVPLVVLGIFALIMAVVGAITLASWGDLRKVDPGEAQRIFAEARAQLGDSPAYIELSSDGSTLVHRELEQAQPSELQALHVITLESSSSRLLEIAFPFWFVRLKMSRTMNLGTLASILAHDWKNLDLNVSEDDLERRGPGLVLDHTASSGSRILLWTD